MLGENHYEEEQEAQGHQEAEEKEGTVAHGQAHADFGERPGVADRVG